jgi:hypothetical protein
MSKKLYTYVITIDDGKSPCYTDGIFSLACCKPQIRRMVLKNKTECEKRNKEPEEVWIAGIRRSKEKNKAMVVFLAKIDDVLKLEEYYDNPEYDGRADRHYHNVHTIYINGKLPETIEEAVIKKECKDIWADKENEHGALKKGGEMTDNQRRDIYGASVLISKHFDHCTVYDDVWELTNKLSSALGGLLDDYINGNERHYHRFNNWSDFDEAVKNINLTTHKWLKGLDEKDGKDGGCNKKKKPVCGGC